MFRIVLVLFLFSFGSGQQVNDPCTQRTLSLFDIVKRWPFYTRNETIDDSTVQDGLYVSLDHGVLIDYPPGAGRCGGKYPIWQKEQKKGSSVVCVQNENSTCFKEFELKHQDCRFFSVYELRTEVKGSVFCLQPNFCGTSNDLCKNGGTCINERDGVSCQCPDGFSGPTCEGGSSLIKLEITSRPIIIIICLSEKATKRFRVRYNPCSVSKPLPLLNSIRVDRHTILPHGWYSVPKGLKTVNHPPSVSGCRFGYNVWSLGRLGNSEILCEEISVFPCMVPYISMTRTCADRRVFKDQNIKRHCFECQSLPLDILVIEDVSSSVMNNDYQKMKDFILDNIRVLNISRTKNNVAFLSFASTAKVGFHLNTHSNTMDVVEAIASANGEGGGSLVSTALEQSASDVFTYHNGDRAEADNIVLLFTDGLFKDGTSLEQDIETLKGRAEIYVVTVGPVVSNSTLVEMATTLDHILRLGDPSTATVITSALHPDLKCRAEQETVYEGR